MQALVLIFTEVSGILHALLSRSLCDAQSVMICNEPTNGPAFHNFSQSR